MAAGGGGPLCPSDNQWRGGEVPASRCGVRERPRPPLKGQAPGGAGGALMARQSGEGGGGGPGGGPGGGGGPQGGRLRLPRLRRPRPAAEPTPGLRLASPGRTARPGPPPPPLFRPPPLFHGNGGAVPARPGPGTRSRGAGGAWGGAERRVSRGGAGRPPGGSGRPRSGRAFGRAGCCRAVESLHESRPLRAKV